MGGARISGTTQDLLAEARRTADVDLVDDDALEPITRLLDSLNRSANFTAAGAVQKREWIVRLLRNRLRMQRDLLSHPEIDEIELLAPLLINAMPRTGSTKTQKLLAATGHFNFLPFWMCMNSASVTGVPGEDLTERVAEIERYATWFLSASPQTRFGHLMEATEPEEEAYVMMQSLRAPCIAGFAAAPDYVSWANTQDLADQYRYLWQTLKYLVWQGLADPAKPFVLKCVVNLGLESEIRSAMPGVNIAVVHRDPAASIPSAALLGRCFRTAFTDNVPDLSATPTRWGTIMDRHLRHRAEHPEQVFHDIDYLQVRDNASQVITSLCDFAGTPATAETLQRVAAWEAGNPQHKHGTWSYAAEDFGFTLHDIRREFADYYEWVDQNGIASWTPPAMG